jgi:hypothetical protein
MAYVLSDEMKTLMEKKFGMKYSEIEKASFSEIHKVIKKKVKHKLRFINEPGHTGRGNVLIALGNIIWPDDPIYSYYKKIR